MREKLKIFYFSVIAALSSFLFGLFLTSEMTLYDRLRVNFDTYKFKFEFIVYESLFASVVFLGAFFSSMFNYLANDIDRKHVLIANNLTYLIGSLMILYFKNIFVLLFARFIIGLGAGISCCIVPNYVFSVTDDRNRGFYMSFHSIGIVLGLVLGKTLGYFFTSDGWYKVYIIITSFVLLHTLALFIIRKCPSETCENDHTTIAQLFKNRRAYRSIFLAVSFHIAQHACGIDYFTLFSEKILEKEPSAERQGIYTLAFSALISIISCNFIDKLGRKFFICLSTAIILSSTFLMGLGFVEIPVMYLYLFGFNVGMSSIPWFITNEIFPAEFVMPATRLTIGVNWMSAFILSFINTPLHSLIDNRLFLLYSASMAVFMAIVVGLFKETKNRPVEFQ